MTGRCEPQELPSDAEGPADTNVDPVPTEIPPEDDAVEEVSSAKKPAAAITQQAEPAARDTIEEPVEEPPEEDADKEAVTAGAWHRNKKVNGVYGTNHKNNSWIFLGGVGWRKLSDKTESGNTAMTMVSAHARQLARPVNALEDGQKIRQVYVW